MSSLGDALEGRTTVWMDEEVLLVMDLLEERMDDADGEAASIDICAFDIGVEGVGPGDASNLSPCIAGVCAEDDIIMLLFC